MVGMALACSLASMPLTKQLTVPIIDSNPALRRVDCIKKDDLPDFYIRTWQYVQHHRHAYFDKMEVWDYTGLGYTKYNARDADKEILGNEHLASGQFCFCNHAISNGRRCWFGFLVQVCGAE